MFSCVCNRRYLFFLKQSEQKIKIYCLSIRDDGYVGRSRNIVETDSRGTIYTHIYVQTNTQMMVLHLVNNFISTIIVQSNELRFGIAVSPERMDTNGAPHCSSCSCISRKRRSIILFHANKPTSHQHLIRLSDRSNGPNHLMFANTKALLATNDSVHHFVLFIPNR